MTSSEPRHEEAGASLGNPPPAPEPGRSPNLQARLASGHDGTLRTWALPFRGAAEIMSGLTDFASREGLKGGYLSGIGALQSARLAFFDRGRKDYVAIPIDHQVECLSLNGTIGLVDGKPLLHVHYVVGYPDGSVKGGHVVEAVVWPTMEVSLTESNETLPKSKDQESGLELFAFRD